MKYLNRIACIVMALLMAVLLAVPAAACAEDETAETASERFPMPFPVRVVFSLRIIIPTTSE